MHLRRHIPSSSTRDILRMVEGKDAINFSAGLPAAELIPFDQLRAAVDRVLTRDAVGAMSYGTTEGYAPLRALVAERLLRPRGVMARADEVMITSGAQQALDLVGKVLIETGCEVLIERPSYLAAIQAFSVFGPRFIEVPLGPCGVQAESLDAVLRQHRQPAFFYGIPSFHNPAGTCVPVKEQPRMAEVLLRHGVPLVEDTPYLELAYETDVPDLVSGAMGDDAIVLGSASKLVAPGLRLGWLWTRSCAFRELVAAKQAADLCGSAFTQRVLFETLSALDLDEHLARLRQEYRRRRDAMVVAVRQYLPPRTICSVPSGGMFVWAALPPDLSSRELLGRTVARGVVFTPGQSFFACDPRPDNYLRLNFTGNPPERIRTGVAIIGEEAVAMAANGPRAAA